MYVRKIEDQVLTLRVSGKLWMRSLVMSDVETGTEWSHLLGRGMAGEWKGASLEPIVSDMATWKAWRDEHPETTVLDMPPTTDHYTRTFYREPRAFVFGFEVGGRTWALPLESMLRTPLHPFKAGGVSLVAALDRDGMVIRLFEAKVEDQSLDFVAVDEQTFEDRQTRSTWQITSGQATAGPMAGKRLKQRVGIMSFRKAWQNFHPESTDVAF